MTTYKPEEIKDAVRAHYGGRAEQVLTKGEDPGCCGSSSAGGYAAELYGADSIAGLPESIVSYGCGNPTAIAGLRAGETVLDLGSGAGLDCFLSAKQVGDSGHVIGLDMTDSMLDLARTNQQKVGLSNVEFRKGEMEAMPVEDASVDVIISNCVINLSPDKDAVFRESFRVLRPGGRLHVSDVVLVRDLTAEEEGDLASWAGCTSVALHKDDYQARLQAAGFAGVSVDAIEYGDKPWRSALITAYRQTEDGRIIGPGASSALPHLDSTIPLTMVGEGGACCDTTGSCC